MLCAPFQCDICWFINLKGRTPDVQCAQDRLNLALIQRVNLDVFWEKEPSTVEGIFWVFQKACEDATHLGLTPAFMVDKGAWPLADNVGFGEAMLMLWQSLQRNRSTKNLVQFDTIRKLWSMSANLTRCTTNSVLFTKFIKGCEKRMGRNIKQDVALSVDILLQVLKQLQDELQSSARNLVRAREIVLLGSALVIGFCDAL
jgi:hypothetical protein